MESKKEAFDKKPDEKNRKSGDGDEKRLDKLIEKLEKLEVMLLDIEARLDFIEKALGVSSDPVLKRALELSKVELSLATGVIRNCKIFSYLPKRLSDDITLAIMISLLSGPQTITKITENVREMRGKGSRRIVSERLKMLEAQGIVKHVNKGNKKVYYLNLGSLTRESPSSQRSSSELS